MDNLNIEIFNLYKKCHKILEAEVIKSKKGTDYFRSDTVPMFYNHFENSINKILMVGINPSLDDGMVKSYTKNYGSEDFLTLSKLNDLNFDNGLKTLINFQEALMGKRALQGVKEIPYFKPFDAFVSEIDLSGETDWEQYDLFSFRFTNQKVIEKIIKIGMGSNDPTLKFYFNESLLRFKNVISKNKFKAIVIVNAYASRILRNELSLTWNEKIGTYEYNGIPVFLSGMISGQRALDIGSLERLKWHLRNIFKKSL